MHLRGLAVVVFAPLVACSSTPASVEPRRLEAATPSPDPIVTVASTATHDSVATAPSTTSVAVAAPAEPPVAPEPPPLTAAEQKDTQRLCKPLMSAMAKAKAPDQSPADALRAALAKPPPSMKPADVERCRDLLGRGIHGYITAAREVEATVILGQIALRAVGAYRETGKLCPDAAPVPANRDLVAKGPYESTAADWTSPGWTCLHFSFEGQPQRFQYEVRADADGKGFQLLAHGNPGGTGRFVTIAQHGKIGDKGIEIGSVEHR